jgi:hypothetical protein
VVIFEEVEVMGSNGRKPIFSAELPEGPSTGCGEQASPISQTNGPAPSRGPQTEQIAQLLHTQRGVESFRLLAAREDSP